jgi:lipoic acid synthetase
MAYDKEQAVGLKKPPWLKKTIPSGHTHEDLSAMLNGEELHTVCQEAKCPNIWECFSRKTATFMIMGPLCTRNCSFCAVGHGPSGIPDLHEPIRVAEAVKKLKLEYVVITSVTRDDLLDGGASIFAETVEAIRQRMPDTLIELLIPDFKGDKKAIETIVRVFPDVLNHNIETVSRLYDSVRPEAEYRRSLNLLKLVKMSDPSMPTKSGIMLGLGESSEEILETFQDLLEVECNLLTIGQYLQPSPEHLPVKRFIHPEEFDYWREIGLKMGFAGVASGPFVRSSYQARQLYFK